MVHTGFSRGCDRCRQRRLACDRTMPECANCTSQGLSCSGYRDFGGFLFKDESTRVISNGKQRHKPRSTASAWAATGAQAMTTGDSDPANQSHKLPKLPALFTYAVNHNRVPEDMFLLLFLEAYTLFNRGPTPSQRQFKALAQFYRNLDPTSPVSPVLSQVAGQAMSLYRGAKSTPPVQLQSSIDASEAVREALCDPLRSQTNEILLALILLDLGERMEYIRSSDGSCVGHCPAAVALISKRAPESFQDDISQILLNAARHSAIRTSLWCVQQDLDLDVFSRAQTYGLSTHFTTLDFIISRTVTLRRRMISSCRGEWKSVTHSLDKLFLSCQRRAAELREWFAGVPKDWRPVMLPSPGLGNLSCNCDRLEAYASCEIAFVYNQARCTQLLLLGMMHRLSVIDMPASAETTQANTRTQARALCGAILSSAPYLFEAYRDPRIQGLDTNEPMSSEGHGIVKEPLLLGLPVGARLGHWCLSEILQLMLRIVEDREFGICIDHKLIAVAKEIIAKLWRI